MKTEAKDIDEKSEKILRQLGFKPNQIFDMTELEEKVCLFYNVVKPEEKIALIGSGFVDCSQQTFLECIIEMLDGSNVLQKYVRFFFKGRTKRAKRTAGENNITHYCSHRRSVDLGGLFFSSPDFFDL